MRRPGTMIVEKTGPEGRCAIQLIQPAIRPAGASTQAIQITICVPPNGGETPHRD